MTKAKLFLVLFVCLLLLLFRLITHQLNPSLPISRPQPPGAIGSKQPKPNHPNLFFDKYTFYDGITRARKENKLSNYHISGGIIPHHLFPGFILADFFNRLSVQNPKTIIIIGPNHYERGEHKLLTSVFGWETPYGIVDPNTAVINALILKNLLKIDEQVLPKDHSVAGLMPYIKYYLPEADVVPILVSGLTTQIDAENLAGNLVEVVDEDSVLIAAVDFSHYLTSNEAREKDRITLAVLKNYDYRQLFTFDNDYLDSPASIAVLLMMMQKMGTAESEILFHTNSGELQNNDNIETTSYFSIAYY